MLSENAKNAIYGAFDIESECIKEMKNYVFRCKAGE